MENRITGNIPINRKREKSAHRGFPQLHVFAYFFRAKQKPSTEETYNHSLNGIEANEGQYFFWIQVLAFAYRKQNLIFGPHFAK
jgi:hypothetical protein